MSRPGSTETGVANRQADTKPGTRPRNRIRDTAHPDATKHTHLTTAPTYLVDPAAERASKSPARCCNAPRTLSRCLLTFDDHSAKQ